MIFKIAIFLIILFFANLQNAEEILIYADNIDYDSEKNIIAKGNAKIISENRIIISDLIIYNKKKEKYVLPLVFTFKDENGNYYYGQNGSFSKDLNSAEMNEAKLLLNDGSRIVGKKIIRNNHIDIISKGSYTPCTSRIKISKFICPIWQVEGEKILHDNKNLFLYNKHAKMKIVNLPVFYLPYLVTPSPLRKERKSGFLTPSLSLKFLDVETSQSTALPYYFNIDLDKELTLTPTFNYGGGVSSSQRFIFDYNQKLSGGTLTFDISMDTNLENKNNNDWFKDGSIISKYNNNLNEKYNLKIDSAFQTKKTYIRNSSTINEIKYKNSLSSTLNLSGYNLKKIDDQLKFIISSYQVVKNNEDNKTTPTALPYISYSSGIDYYKETKYENSYQFYNIFRDTAINELAQKQKKISHLITTNNIKYNFKSKINIKTELHNQYFETENKLINSISQNSSYYRAFPISGIFIETPIKNSINNLLFTPKVSLIVSPGKSNTNKISNEESSNNLYSINNLVKLNRYSGTDKLDNSKRLNFGFNITKNKIQINFAENYEFTKNSNYHYAMGNYDYLGDAMMDISYNGIIDKDGDGIIDYKDVGNSLGYTIRYDPDQQMLKKQTLDFKNQNRFGQLKISYLDQKKETNFILEDGTETINFDLSSNKINKYSKINVKGYYDLIKDKTNEYNFGYSYFDECFGVNIDYKREFYEDVGLKPEDTLTLMFSFKNLGAYKSTNLAVSENDKQDIEWEGASINDELFN